MKGRRLLPAAIMTLALAVCPAGRGGRAPDEIRGTNRCLVIGYDHFTSMPDTAPCSANNVEIVAALLSDYTPETERVIRRVDGPGTGEELEELIRDTFRNAGEADTSYVYLSTHGVAWAEDGAERMAFLLCDGTAETELEPARLREMLDAVPGRKVLILDACHSGAALAAFDGPEYRVMASGRADEDSYFWMSGPDRDTGTGYFTSALDGALRASLREQIDPDGDGRVTMAELRARTGEIYGASDAQWLTGGADDALFSLPEEPQCEERIRGLTFDGLTREEDTLVLSFRFSLDEATRMEYRIVTRKDGKWDFENALRLPDRERTGTVRGLLSPGDKTRKIRISADSLGEEGTVLLQIISLRGLHGQVPVLEASRRISADGAE